MGEYPRYVANTYTVFNIGLSTDVSHYDLMIAAGKPRFYAITNNVLKCDVVATTATLTPHQWHHVCVVQNGTRPYLYLDGTLCAMTDTDATTLGYWGNTLGTWDKGAIGITVTNGTLINDYKGAIAYVKYATFASTVHNVWSANDVKQEYDYRAGYGTGSGVTKGVLCTWPLDGDAVEDTTGGGTYDGTIVSDVQYDPEYSQLTSKLRLLAPVVADDICLLPRGMDGSVTAVVIKAA